MLEPESPEPVEEGSYELEESSRLDPVSLDPVEVVVGLGVTAELEDESTEPPEPAEGVDGEGVAYEPEPSTLDPEALEPVEGVVGLGVD